MSKKKKEAKMPKKEMMMFMSFAVIVILLLTLVAVVVDNREDKLTAWATIKSVELRNFIKDCRGDGGSFDVRPTQAPRIIFVCGYPDRMVEYTLEPGR